VVVHWLKWTRLFSAQYPEESRIANNIAIYTSLALLSRQRRTGRWFIRDLARFEMLHVLVVVVDEQDERNHVAYLMENDDRQVHLLKQNGHGFFHRQSRNGWKMKGRRIWEKVGGNFG
jgi:hypothetical protein